MRPNEDPIVIPIEADFAGFETALQNLEKSSQRFANSFSGAMRSVIRDGASFEDTLKSMALRMSDIALQAGLKPMENAVSGLFENLAGSIGSSLIGQSTSAFDVSGFLGPITSALSGNSYSSAASSLPTARTMANATLSRPASTNVTFNVSTPDVEGFRKSQTQISTLLARSVSRSHRGN